jgi:hypothetical protein
MLQDIGKLSANAATSGEATLAENVEGSGLLLPASPIATLARARRRELTRNATDDQYGKPSMGDQTGRRGQQAASKQASCIRDDDDDEKEDEHGADAAGDVKPDNGSTFSPYGDGSNAGCYEDHVSVLHTPESFVSTFISSVVRDEPDVTAGVPSREGMIVPDSDPLNLNARREQLRAQGIDC